MAKKLAELIPPISKKLEEVIKSTKKLAEIVKKTDVEDGNTQLPAIEKTTISQSLRDTLSLMKTSKNFFKLEQRDGGEVFWNDVLYQPLGEKRIRGKDQEYDITPDIQAYFTNTKLTIKFLDNVEKETVFDILINIGFFNNIPEKGFTSARMKDALYILPKVIYKIRNPPLPSIENVENFSDPEGQGVKINTHQTLSTYTQDLKYY